MHREHGRYLARREGLDAEDCYWLLNAGWAEAAIVAAARQRRVEQCHELIRIGRTETGQPCHRTAELLDQGHMPRLAHDVRMHETERCGLGAIQAAETCLDENFPRLPSRLRGELAVHLEALTAVLEEALR